MSNGQGNTVNPEDELLAGAFAQVALIFARRERGGAYAPRVVHDPNTPKTYVIEEFLRNENSGASERRAVLTVSAKGYRYLFTRCPTRRVSP